mgnify:CR=1 FL=1
MSSEKRDTRFFEAFTDAKAEYQEKNLKVVRYDLLTRDALLEMDKENALVLVAVSPLEIHGGFLPLGTDLIEAIMMFQWIKEVIQERQPDKEFIIVEASPLPIGWSGVRGMVGTIHVRHKTFRDVLQQYLEGFVRAGFKRFLVSSAHHGNIHAYAIEEAALRVMKKYEELDVRIASPLNWIVKKLMIDHPRKTWGDIAEQVGQPPLTEEEYEALAKDDHSSLMEVSFMNHVNSELVDPAYKEKDLHTTPISHMFKKLLSAKLGTLGGPTGAGYNGVPSMADSRDWIPLYKALIKDVGWFFIEGLYEKSHEEYMDEYATSFFYNLVMLKTNWKWRAVVVPALIITALLCYYPLFPWNLLSLLYIPFLLLFVGLKIKKALEPS